MKTAAIIAEYNPLHEGHKVPIDHAKNVLGADAVIVIMSGDWVQRGEPAIFDKYTRANAALLAGADAVLEIPVDAVLSSAQFYAEAGVKIASEIPGIHWLVFGTESGNSKLFHRAAEILALSGQKNHELKTSLSKGKTYALAMADFIRERLIEEGYSYDEVSALLDGPNNILGLEYCASILKQKKNHPNKADIQPIPVLREGGSHNKETIEEEYASATALRKVLHRNPTQVSGEELEQALSFVPGEIRNLFSTAYYEGSVLNTSDLDALLIPILSSLRKEDKSKRPSYCPADLWNRIINEHTKYTGFDHFASLIKTKNRTLAGVKRILCRMIIYSFQNDYKKMPKSLSFLRLLSANEKGMKVLGNASLPLITSPGRDSRKLDEESKKILDKELCASEITRLLRVQNMHRSLTPEAEHRFMVKTRLGDMV